MKETLLWGNEHMNILTASNIAGEGLSPLVRRQLRIDHEYGTLRNKKLDGHIGLIKSPQNRLNMAGTIF